MACLDRDDVDEGRVFKTYNEFQRAVESAAAKGGGTTIIKSAKSAKDSSSGSAPAPGGPMFAKSGKSSKSVKSEKAHSKAAKRHLRSI